MKGVRGNLVIRFSAGMLVLIVGLVLFVFFWTEARQNGQTVQPSALTNQAGETSGTHSTLSLATPTLTRADLLFSGVEALRQVEIQMDYGPRPTGSDASRQLAEYLLKTFESYSWEVEVQPFVYQGVGGQNLLARAGRSGGPVYLFGAHYDTRRRADQDANAPDQPVPGANDGASGVAVLLELARVVDLTRIDGQVWLVLFDAEDNGRLDGWEYIAGSRIFVSELEFYPEYMILVDMVGDANQDIYFEGNSNPDLRNHLWSIAFELGYGDTFIPEVRHSMLDDHTAFLEQGIPAVDIIDFDYPYWHTTQDTFDKVSADSLERVGRVLEMFIENGARLPTPPDEP